MIPSAQNCTVAYKHIIHRNKENEKCAQRSQEDSRWFGVAAGFRMNKLSGVILRPPYNHIKGRVYYFS